ncbi:hypothetical protein HPB48_006951 [Haemaphysalis longicornis]|uniref:Peptidase C2 calpain domain-containing protein n=1 Tax=Haemaphysalis longicornis TaxID=44386 RepID=A0A9J6GSK1_HAELO|nr:hypothetical protein HPB48_006951 [Haemaphysalis longicornis]
MPTLKSLQFQRTRVLANCGYMPRVAWEPSERALQTHGVIGFAESFVRNPQYMVTLHEPDDEDEDGECTVIVALLQRNRRYFQVHEDTWLAIAFSIYEVEDPDNCPVPLTADYVGDYRVVGECARLHQSREVTYRFRLLPGTFCIIPGTAEADQAGDFLIRIFTEKKSHCREHDESTCMIAKPIKPGKEGSEAKEKPDKVDGGGDGGEEKGAEENEVDGEAGEDSDDEEIDQSVKDAFGQVCNDDGTVCCHALQKLLKSLSEESTSQREKHARRRFTTGRPESKEALKIQRRGKVKIVM